MKIILTTLCLLVASTTAFHAVYRDKELLRNGDVIAFHSSEGSIEHHYTVKYDNKLFWCTVSRWGINVKCEEMKK